MNADFIFSYLAQLTWIFGAFELVKSFSTRSTRLSATAGIVTASLSGLVIVNTIFTWPKLMASGFLLSSFASAYRWFVHRRDVPLSHHHLTASSLLAGLAALSHGGVLFALIPMMAWITYAVLRPTRRKPTKSLTCFFAPLCGTYMTWSLWQRYGDPPGNRLLKWHIGGDPALDRRGLFRTLMDSYRRISFGDMLFLKWTNIENLVRNRHHTGRFLTPYQVLNKPAAAIETDFFGVVSAVSWALPVLTLGALVSVVPRKRVELERVFRVALPGWLWWMASLLCWVLLMFGPSATINHHGPLTMALLPLILIGAMTGTAMRLVWLVGTVIQATAWMIVYPMYRYTWESHATSYLLSLSIVSVMIIAAVLNERQLRKG
jgi:hypothetical protein